MGCNTWPRPWPGADKEVLRRRLVMRNAPMRVLLRSAHGMTKDEMEADLHSVVNSLFLQGVLQQDELEWAACVCVPTPAIRAPAVVLQLRPHEHRQRARELAVGSLAFIVENERRQLSTLADVANFAAAQLTQQRCSGPRIHTAHLSQCPSCPITVTSLPV